MSFIKKYICEIVFVINLFFIIPNHDFSVWWQRPVINDAFGYYSYLPAIFIHQDLSYDYIYEPWKKHYKDVASDDPKEAFIVTYKGKHVNKYPPGVAYFQSPFFFMGHLSAIMLHKEADGYSDIYMYFLCIGAIFWQYLFLKLLKRIFQFYYLSDTSFLITAPLLSFGTNIWFYTQIFGTYSHLYTLLSISLFFYGGLKFFNTTEQNLKSRYFFWMLLGFSMALITRNINVIAVLLLPCMGFQFKQFTTYLQVFRNKTALIGLAVSGLLIFSMFLLWKLQTGYWIVDSYPNEHFYWSKPQIFKSLFSAHKGWFVWTPIALAGLIGLIYAPRKLALNSIAVLALVIYITSSWWCWDYGTAFSMRAYIDWYLIVSLGLGFLFHHLASRHVLFYAVLSLCVVFSGINLLQSVQFMRGIISGHSQGIEYTLKNFFRLRPIMQYGIPKNITEESKIIFNNFNNEVPDKFVEVNEKTPFSKGIDISLDEQNNKSYTHVRFGANITATNLDNEIFLCGSVTDKKDSVIFWHQMSTKIYILPDKPEKVETGFIIPPNLPVKSRLKVFFWEPKGNTTCTIDDMYVEFMKVGLE